MSVKVIHVKSLHGKSVQETWHPNTQYCSNILRIFYFLFLFNFFFFIGQNEDRRRDLRKIRYINRSLCMTCRDISIGLTACLRNNDSELLDKEAV